MHSSRSNRLITAVVLASTGCGGSSSTSMESMDGSGGSATQGGSSGSEPSSDTSGEPDTSADPSGSGSIDDGGDPTTSGGDGSSGAPPETGESDDAGASTGDCEPLDCADGPPCGLLETCGIVVDCGACIEVPVDDLRFRHVVADPYRRRLYATVGEGSRWQDHLVSIVPETGLVVDAVEIGDYASALAIADDFGTVWVGLNGEPRIRRVDLTGSRPVAGETHDLPLGFAQLEADPRELVVLPGAPDSVAVSLFRGSVTAFAGVTILDAGIPRPPQAFAPQGATRLTDGPPGWLFGYDDLTTEFGFYVVSVDEQGAQQTQYLDFVSGFDTDIEYAHDRVYGTDGTVIDVSDPTAPAVIGDFGFYGLVHPAAADRVYMLSGDTLRLLDPTTLSQLDSATIEALEDDDIATDFVTADEATFAVLVGSLPGRYSLRLFDNPLR